MKKITSLLTLLLLCCVSAFAQEPSEMDGKSITVGGAVARFEANTWYFLHQARVYGTDTGTHSEVGSQPVSGGFIYDTGASHIKKSDLEAVPEASPAASKAAYIVRFIESEDNKGAYKIQFGTGRFMMDAPASGSGSSKYDAQDFNIYNINDEDGHFAINKWNMSNILDNNGANQTCAYWGSGVVTELNGNNDWAIHEVIWGSISEYDAALAELISVLTTYENETFEAGTAPGQYGVAEVAAFEEAIEAAGAADGDDSLTPEQLLTLAQNIKNTYEAVVASRVPFAVEITPGYYYITSALDFVTTTPGTTTEDPDTGEEITTDAETIHHTKAIYTNNTNGRWGELDETTRKDANYLWKVVAAGDKKYHLINCQNETQFNAVQTSSAITLSAQSDSLVVFDTAGLEGIYNIRLAAQAERDYFYIHCGGHGGGTGTQGNLVGWCNTVEDEAAHASEWKLEAVDEATALAIIDACSPQKQIKVMTDSAAVIIAAVPAQIKVAQDTKTEINEEYPLITSAEQLSSPMTEPNEGSIEALIDGNAGTFWHSQWSGRQPDNGVDYIQIEMTEDDITNAAFVYTRRAVTNDHLTEASVYGTNDAEAEKADCELLATVSLPFSANNETLTSDVFPVKGYQYIRIYEEATTNNRGYFHMAELQLYPATVSSPYATTQAKERAAEIAAVENAIEAWNAIDAATATVADYTAAFNKLNEAYAAWQAVYVNPAALRQAIANAPDTKVVKIGNNPGEWSGEAGSSINNLIDEAKKYDQACKYTPAESERLINSLNKAEEDMFAAANPVKTGKWYRIRFATEAEYDEAGWEKGPADAIEHAILNEETSHALFGKYVAAGKHANETLKFQNEDGSEGSTIQYNIESLEDEDVTMSATVAFMDKGDIKDADAALWQFVAVGDTAYVLQNKATGLYMRTAGTSGAVTLNPQPALFTTRAIGYGKNLIKANYINGADNTYLHAERATNNLVTWNATAIESNSALYIEEAEDVTAQPSTEFTMTVWPGQMKTMCYPVELTAKDGTFYQANLNGTTLTLTPLKDNIAPAGMPVVYVADGDYEELQNDKEKDGYNGDNYETATFTHGTEFVSEPAEFGSLTGSFVQKTIGNGCMWAEGDTFVVTKKSSNTLGANTAYINEATEDLEAIVTIEIGGETNISTVMANVSKVGGIYTLDGKYVGKGNINSMKNMQKGIYVVNGVKVAVK